MPAAGLSAPATYAKAIKAAGLKVECAIGAGRGRLLAAARACEREWLENG